MKKSKLEKLWRITAILFFTCLLAIPSFAQEKTLSGVVVDENGAFVPGVTVVVKGTTTGTITDNDGKFSFKAPQNAQTLTLSYIGLRTQEISIGNQTNFNVTMLPDVIGVEEVVVTGYATQKKASLTGAISQVSSDELNISAPASAIQRMQGHVSGVSITNAHTPGGDATVRIRGMGTVSGSSTMNKNNPLYVIDGVPTKSNMSQLNPNDIESISVLKDASSAAIYGARGANGVIIITTKRGKSGEPKITFDARYGMSEASNQYDLLNTQEYGEAMWMIARNSGLPVGNALYGMGENPVIPDYALAGKATAMEGDPAADPSKYKYAEGNYYFIVKSNKQGTNWYDEIFRTAPVQEYNLAVTGGTTKGTYAFSAGYYSEDGILIHSSWDRYSIRSNADAKITKWLEVGESMGVVFSRQKGNFSDNGEGTVVSQAYRMQPIIPVYDIMGNFAGTKVPLTGNGENPVAVAWRDRNDLNDNLRAVGNVYGQINLLPGLNAKTLFGFDYRNNEVKDIFLKNPEFSEAKPNDNLNLTNYNTIQWNWANTLNWAINIEDIHKLNFLVGTEAVSSYYRYFNASRASFFSQDPNYMYLDAGESAINNGGLGSDWTTVSYFARANYDFMGRYLLEGTFRRDGSSRFGSNHRWGDFPAFSAGWRISEESFMSGSKVWLDDMKIRIGWGMSGNDEIGDYNGFTTFRTNPQYSKYALGGGTTSSTAGFDSNAFGNKDAKWEATTTSNLGFDLTMLKGRFSVNVDLWKRVTTDMLFQVPIAQVKGDATAPYVNVGEMKNQGIDFTGILRNEIGHNFKWSVTANISTYKNEIVKLSNNPKDFIEGDQLRQKTYTRSYAGWEFPSYYGYVVEGIFQTQAEADAWPKAIGSSGTYNKPGHFKFKDISGPEGKPDGIIDSNDRTKLGSPHPDFYGGVTFDVQYKAFDVTAFFTGSYGNEMINYVRRWIDYNIFPGSGMSKDRLYKSWGSPYLSDNSKAKLAIAENADEISQEPSSHFVEDASYLRLKTLQVGFNLSQNTVKRYGMTKFRIYLQATNIWTLTNYSGLDPEIQTGTDNLLGVDQGAWPTPRQYMIGVNLGF
ncbi:MAG TPA: TonB-dependent receptor [Prolixibacteraceae bacterium]|nr:TonB-dependent receptor [Prolixibacteraceae bacterium]